MTTAIRQVGSGSGASSGDGSRPLSNEAVFRIEVSFSSRRSSVIVIRCTARLYSLEKAGAANAASAAAAAATPAPSGDAEWKSIAYGVPCIQLMRDTTHHNSPFNIKLLIAEVESGIGLWESILERGSKYNAMQNNFHTFTVKGKPHAVQFANEDEACRMLESVQDLLYQKEKAETIAFDSKRGEDTIFKKSRSLKKLSKKDISAPCNFKHVSGITAGRTRTCEDELRGTIQRKIRSMSLSSLSSRRNKPRQQIQSDPTPPSKDIQQLEESPTLIRRAKGAGESKPTRSQSFMTKFRNPKKKQHTALVITEIQDDSAAVLGVGRFNRYDDNRRSLPSRLKKQPRPALNKDTFKKQSQEKPAQDKPMRVLSPVRRTVSLSSGDLLTPGQATTFGKSRDQLTHSQEVGPGAAAATGGRTGQPPDQNARPITPQGKASFNYTPYSKSAVGSRRKSSGEVNAQYVRHPNNLGSAGRQYMSEQNLHGRYVSVPQAVSSGGGLVPPSTGHWRGSFHESQIPSTVHEVPHGESLEPNFHHVEDDGRNWSQSMPRLRGDGGSNGWKTQSVQGIARAPSVGGGGGVANLAPHPSHVHGNYQQGGRQGTGMASQRPNEYQPTGENQQRGLEPRPHAMSAQTLATPSNGYDPLPMGVVPPPPGVGKAPHSQGHMTTTAQGGVLQIHEVRNPKPYSLVTGVGTEPRQQNNSVPMAGVEPRRQNNLIPNPAPAGPPLSQVPEQNARVAGSERYNVAPPPSQPGPVQVSAPRVPQDKYDLLNPQTLPQPHRSAHPSQQYDHTNPRGATNPRVTPVQIQTPQVPPGAQIATQHPQNGFIPPINNPPHQPHTSYPGPTHAPQMINTNTSLQAQQRPDPSSFNAHQQRQYNQQSEPHYARGHIMTITTAAQEINADTHVSPSHSYSKVSPVPVQQGHLGNGTVLNGFASIPEHSEYHVHHNSVPISVQAPQMPPRHYQHGSRQTDNADRQTNMHPRAVNDSGSPNIRPCPSHGHQASSSFDGNDSLASHSTVSMDADMAAYTEQMSKALEQFDNLLTKKPSIIQTSF